MRRHGGGARPGLPAHRFAQAFPTSYRENFPAAVAAEDADILAALSAQAPLAVRLYRPLNADAGTLRFKIYNTAKVALSDSLPVLENMGVRVLDEHPYRIGSDNCWIHDLGLQVPPDTELSRIMARFEDCFMQAAWPGGK